MSHWIYIDREHSQDLAVGPYETEGSADHAMQHALLIDGFCEEDCLDAYLSTEEPKLSERDIVHVDLDNPAHTGVGEREDTNPGSPLGVYSFEYETSDPEGKGP